MDGFNPPMMIEFTISPALNQGPCGVCDEMTTIRVACRRLDMEQARVHRSPPGASFQH